MPATPADQNFLFGLLALQTGLIDASMLVAAVHAWTRDKSLTLAEILTRQGALGGDDVALLDGLVGRHLSRHGGRVEESLASVAVPGEVVAALSDTGDPDLETTLGYVKSASAPPTTVRGPEATDTVTLGSAPGDGGRFRVLRSHAQGGLGAVFVALDAELHREVALKQLLERNADDPASRTRFVLEAEITGGLEHPGIVPVYGLGTYEDGRPFYAMRFVRGDSLKDAIAGFHAGPGRGGGDPGAAAIALRGLLRRFTDVCNAIEYAHGRGVIHRDIKPANVIVGKHGETLVVDWGLAKATGARPSGSPGAERTFLPSSGSGSAESVQGAVMGTPAYMAPEQAAGDLRNVGPLSDVYSLGATLYCLLTGRPPFEGPKDAVLAGVVAGRFSPPRQVAPGVDRALEAVCLKAMALDPKARYPTARAVADDVERWAADEPVSAWREPLPRRARRWARRHRAAVACGVGVLAATALAASAGFALVDRERRRAEQLFASAHRLAATLVDTAELRLSERPGQEAARRAVAAEAAEQYDRLADERPADADLQRETGTAHFYLANLLRFFNETDAAESHFATAVDRLARAQALDPADRRLRDREAEVWRDRGLLAYRLGKNGDAGRMLARALEIVAPLRAADPTSPEFRRTEASVLLNSADVALGAGRPDEAEKNARAAVERYDALASESVDAGKVAPAYATSTAGRSVPMLRLMAMNQHANALRELGRHPEALARHDEATAAARALKAAAETPDNLYQYGRTLAQHARTLTETPGRSADAEPKAVEALAVLDALRQANRRSTAYREMSALASQTLARVRAAQGRTDDAVGDAQKAREALESLIRDAPQIPRFSWELGLVLDELAALRRNAGGDDAPALAAQSVEALRRAADAAPENVPYRRDLKRVEAARDAKAP